MIANLLEKLYGAFTQVAGIVTDFIGGAEEGGVFGAIAQLSSGVFGA